MATTNTAGVGLRAVAVLIDLVVWAIAGYGIALATGMTTPTGFELRGGPAFLWILSYFGYYVLVEGLFATTVGKVFVGLRVVGESGGSLEMRASVIRNVIRVVDGLFFYLVGAILIWRSADGQRLGDRLGETYVIKSS